MVKKSYTSIAQMLKAEKGGLYPTAKVVKYGNKIYPSIRRAAAAEGVSPQHIRVNCKIYTREEVIKCVTSMICL